MTHEFRRGMIYEVDHVGGGSSLWLVLQHKQKTFSACGGGFLRTIPYAIPGDVDRMIITKLNKEDKK